MPFLTSSEVRNVIFSIDKCHNKETGHAKDDICHHKKRQMTSYPILNLEVKRNRQVRGGYLPVEGGESKGVVLLSLSDAASIA